MVAFLACLKAGIVAVPVFPPNPLRGDSLRMFCKIVESCQARFALTSAAYNHQKKLAGIRDKLTKTWKKQATWPDSLEWIVTDATSQQEEMKQALRQSDDVSSEAPSAATSDQLAFLQFTSGSTSDPKGVMITHGNLAHNLSIIVSELSAKDDAVVVSWLPQYHDMGLIGAYLGVLYCGGTGYYMSPLTFLQRPMMWIEAVSRFSATHLQAPNFAFKLTSRKFRPDNYTRQSLNLSSVRHVINGAEPVDEDSIEAFYSAFCPFGFKKVIYPTYGLAEHTVFVCSGGTQRLRVQKKQLEVDGKVVLADEEEGSGSGEKEEATVSRLVGCGYPARQGVDVKIVNQETFRAVTEDVVGEIWIQSPSKAAGYYGKPEETKDDFHGKLADSSSNGDGWLRSGDLGFLHQQELFICGRLKDLIIVGGRNYYPQDIEATAEASSDLVRPGCSAAFTIDPTHEGGEEVALVMELSEVPANKKDVERICQPLAQEIRSAINQEHSLGIATIALLKTRTVPKTSSGKIARSWCRKGFVNGTLQIVYQKNFKHSLPAFEIEQTEVMTNGAAERKEITAMDAQKIRSMSREDILNKLVTDVSRVGSLPVESIEKNVALITMLDSLTISQFKGLLESSYAVKISDEYLFRETTTLAKLVDVVKLGYAPDDGEGDHAAAAAASHAVPPGTARGLAGALGCPPGVRCVIL
jgi:acyl-CoA synthetase (AMP-forming)/AMP-acid ligase II